MTNYELVEKFYASFQAKDAEGMTSCYHPEIVFEDPAFGVLKGKHAKKMWHMLLSRGSDLDVKYTGIYVNGDRGSARWTAKYAYGPKKRDVTNHVTANFEFADGKIIRHTDVFDIWKWSRQALGLPGLLLGWTSFMQNKIQSTTNGMLDKYQQK